MHIVHGHAEQDSDVGPIFAGWGKVSLIQGILSEVDMGCQHVEVGLLLKKAILVSSLLFTTETWSGLKENQLKRL